MTFIGICILDIISIYGVIYPLLLVFSLALLIYTLVTHKRRTILDIVIVLVIFLSILAINIQVIIYFYRARTFYFY